MAIERRFIQDSMVVYKVFKYLETKLDRAGFAYVNIQRTPILIRIDVYVTDPGRVIGRKGKSINELTSELSKKFGLENPQLNVVEIKDFYLQPRIIAQRVCKLLEIGKKARPILHFTLKKILDSGAIGAEIVASGKIVAKGGRSKSLRVAAGFIPKSGESGRLVRSAHVTAYPKSGAIGVLVRIVPEGTIFPDKKPIDKSKLELPAVVRHAVEEPPHFPGEKV